MPPPPKSTLWSWLAPEFDHGFKDRTSTLLSYLYMFRVRQIVVAITMMDGADCLYSQEMFEASAAAVYRVCVCWRWLATINLGRDWGFGVTSARPFR